MLSQTSEPEASRADLPAPDLSFEALFRDHFAFVYQNLRRLGVPPASVEDAVQEVFLVVLRRPDAPITSVRGWLFGIARRIAWRQRRSAGRHSRLTEALAEQDQPALDGVGVVAEREAAALLERFLGRLDDDKRAVFLLAELEQMTAPEIARALEVKENTVYSRLRAARQEFDRTFARVRLRERRAAGEGALDERALLLSRARRAHEPSPATRQRVWLVLGPSAGAKVGLAGEASTWTDAPGHAQRLVDHVPTWSGKLAAKLGAAASGHTAWAAAIGLGSVLVLVTRPLAPPDAPAAQRRAAVERVASDSASSTPTASRTEPTDDPRVPFSRLAAAAARAGQAARPEPTPRRDLADNAPRDMSSGTSTPSPAGSATVAATPLDVDALRREATLMADAQAALSARSWARARELLLQHAREFPGGALVEERRVSLITALCSLGQLDAARAEVAKIEAEQPGSAATRKAKSMCPQIFSTGLAPSGD